MWPSQTFCSTGNSTSTIFGSRRTIIDPAWNRRIGRGQFSGVPQWSWVFNFGSILHQILVIIVNIGGDMIFGKNFPPSALSVSVSRFKLFSSRYSHSPPTYISYFCPFTFVIYHANYLTILVSLNNTLSVYRKHCFPTLHHFDHPCHTEALL